MKHVTQRPTAASPTQKIIEAMEIHHETHFRKSLGHEINAQNAQMLRGRSLAILLNEMRTVQTGRTPLKKAIKTHYKKWKIKPRNLTDRKLKESYQVALQLLRRRFIKTEGKTPSAELRFIEFWRKNTRLEIHHNLWIGNHQVDAVVVGFRSNKSIGTIFEIDGPIHNNELKQNKDKSSMKFIETHLRTPVQRISNHDVNWPFVKNLSDNLSTKRPTDYRSLQRWWSKVAILTLAFGGAKLAAEDQIEIQNVITEMLEITSTQLSELLKLTNLKSTYRYNLGGDNE